MASIFNEQCATASTLEAFDDNSGRLEICYSFEMCRWTIQILLELDDW